MIENDVTEMLRRRAGDATVSPDAWDSIVERIDDDESRGTVLTLAPRPHRFNGPVVLGAIAAALLVVVASLALIQDRGEDERVRAADDGSPAPSTKGEPDGRAPATTSAQRPVWPATTDEELARLQKEADAGLRPDLLDPRAVAGGYLSDRFGDESTGRLTQQFAVGEFAQGDSNSGEVAYESPPGGPFGGTVLVRRAGGDGAIWFVVASSSPRVDIKVAAYDGKELTGEAVGAGNGALTVRLLSTDGSDPEMAEPRQVTAGARIDLRRTFAGRPAVVALLTLVEAPSGTVSFTELRVDRFPTGGPPSAAPAFEAAAEAAARRWIRAVAANDADVAWAGLAERSRDAVGGRAGFDRRFAELTEGWGAWSDAPDASYRAVALVDSGTDGSGPLPAELPRLGVVIISGRVSQEGATTFRTVSLPVRGTASEALVDPLVDTGLGIEVQPVDGRRIGRATVLSAVAPAGARVWFVLDDRAPAGPDNSEGADGDQQQASITPRPALSPGQHSFTVAVLTVDGRFFTRSATYTVA